MTDEPYALIGHVRICGSPGWVTTQGHPATGAGDTFGGTEETRGRTGGSESL
jgi:hypothetical protein